MKFAPIVPTKYLSILTSNASCHMALAHLVLSDKNYRKHYAKVKGICILDNGACELKRSVPVENLLEAYIMLNGPDVVVIPDSLQGGNMELYNEFWKVANDFRVINPEVLFMAVPGNIPQCDFMIKDPKVSIIGLNRDWEYGRKTRGDFIENNLEVVVANQKQFHLLGLRKNPIKEIKSAARFAAVVYGVDSSLPYRITSLGRMIDEYRPYPPLINFDQNKIPNEIIEHICRELNWLRDWVSEGCQEVV